MFATTSWIFSLYDLYCLALRSAFVNLDAETISIAFVICFVFSVEPIRSSISLRDAKLSTTLLKQNMIVYNEFVSVSFLSLYAQLWHSLCKLGECQVIYCFIYFCSVGKKVFLNAFTTFFMSSSSANLPVSRMVFNTSCPFVSIQTWNSDSKRTTSSTAI